MNKFGGIDRGQKIANFHMVRESNMPAVLTENLFVDVVADANRLKQKSVIDAIIDGHVQGIANHLGLTAKEVRPVTPERDINVPSPWAESSWREARANGYFDGTRPGAPITREETAIVINRLRRNFLALFAGVNGNIREIEERLQKIEADQE